MITADQIRTGNYIVFNDDDSIAKVIGIHTKTDGVDVEFAEEETYIELDKFSGIGITEEILLKCGFKPEDDEFTIEIDNGWKIVWSNGQVRLKFEELDCEISFQEYKYLHQVQNLYYSLTFKELPVDLQKEC